MKYALIVAALCMAGCGKLNDKVVMDTDGNQYRLISRIGMLYYIEPLNVIIPQIDSLRIEKKPKNLTK